MNMNGASVQRTDPRLLVPVPEMPVKESLYSTHQMRPYVSLRVSAIIQCGRDSPRSQSTINVRRVKL